MRGCPALNEPKTAKFEEIRAEFCVFKSNTSGLKLNLYEPYVYMPNSQPKSETMNHLKTLTMVSMETKVVSKDSLLDQISEKFYFNGF